MVFDMNRSVNYSHLQGLDSAEVVSPSKEPAVINKRESDLVLDLVFAPDKRTGLPSSDISVYLAANTPPQVRDFIKSNIFGDGFTRPAALEGIDDDVLHELTRHSDETVDDYSLRLSAFMQKEKDKVTESFRQYRNYKRSQSKSV